MSWNLTNPGLQYDQSGADPTTGALTPLPPVLRFFRNAAAQGHQAALDEMGTVQPSRSDISGPNRAPIQIPQPSPLSMSQQTAGGPLTPDPLTEDPASTQITQNPDPTSRMPRFLRPTFAQTTQDAQGVPVPVNDAQTKFGKLMRVLAGASQGALAGWGQGSAGAGAQQAREVPLQMAGEQQRLVGGNLENQQARLNLAFTPLRFAQQSATIQRLLAQTRREGFQTPRNGGVFNTDTGQYVAPPNQVRDLPEQRQSFAQDNPDMFGSAIEKKNFVLYGTQPRTASTQPNEWQLRMSAARGDATAQRVLQQRLGEQKSIAAVRGQAASDAKSSEADDAGRAEQIAATLLSRNGNDPDKALQHFNALAPTVTDPNERRLGPQIVKAIRARKNVNKPQSPIDKILSGDVEGGLGDLNPPEPE